MIDPLQTIELYQKWRRGIIVQTLDEIGLTPKVVGEALDSVMCELREARYVNRRLKEHAEEMAARCNKELIAKNHAIKQAKAWKKEAKDLQLQLERQADHFPDATKKADHKDVSEGTRLYAAPPPAPAAVPGLNPNTAKLVLDFSEALALKLRAAEEKYGYSNGWINSDWENICRHKLLEHIEKGDPRDVAAYCAFMWFHGWSTASPALSAVPEWLRDIGRAIATQDNCCTDQPLFIVQQKRRFYGIDPNYSENICWISCDGESPDDEELSELEKFWDENGHEPDNWTRTGFRDEWEFVTACFTEKGCDDFITRDGHNLNEPRVYADGSYRNEEFRQIRNWLLSLAATQARESE